MKRHLILAGLLFIACGARAETTRYQIRPVYTSIRFSIVKWGVLKEEGVFREFAGTLDLDPDHPERARVDVVVQAGSLDTKNETRDRVVRSDDFLNAVRYPTLEFHSTEVRRLPGRTTVTGNLTIHGTTHRVRFSPASLGMRDLPSVGKLAGFETTFTINRRDFGVLGNRWGAIPGVLSDDVEVHILIGATNRDR
jgi:polyisoprenoid-binding protein YceI